MDTHAPESPASDWASPGALSRKSTSGICQAESAGPAFTALELLCSIMPPICEYRAVLSRFYRHQGAPRMKADMMSPTSTNPKYLPVVVSSRGAPRIRPRASICEVGCGISQIAIAILVPRKAPAQGNSYLQCVSDALAVLQRYHVARRFPIQEIAQRGPGGCRADDRRLVNHGGRS